MRLKGRGIEAFPQKAVWIRVCAHAPLFVYYVALGIELAEDGICNSVGFKKRPDLKLIGRQRQEVIGGVRAGGCVEADPAKALIRLRNFVSHYVVFLLLL